MFSECSVLWPLFAGFEIRLKWFRSDQDSFLDQRDLRYVFVPCLVLKRFLCSSCVCYFFKFIISGEFSSLVFKFLVYIAGP